MTRQSWEQSPIAPHFRTDGRHLDRRQGRTLRGVRSRGRRTLARKRVSLGRTRRSTAQWPSARRVPTSCTSNGWP